MKNGINIFKAMRSIAIIAMMAVIVFSMAACPGRNLTEADRAITDFEKLLDEITPLVQKMMQGDMEAVAAFEAFDEDRIDAVIERLESLREQFTPAQEARIEELLYKFQQTLGFGF